MLLTRIWAVLLAILATGCLAGMFLLSAGQSGDFTDADRDAVRAVTEAGIAALTAEIGASKVQRVNALVINDELREALARPVEPDEDDEATPLPQVLAEVSEELRVRTGANLTVAIVDKDDTIVAANGISESDMADVAASKAFRGIPPTEDGQFSISLGGIIHVAKVTRSVVGGKRLLAVDRLNLGAGSLLRRVLGSDTPAGIVRNGQLVGEIIGDQPIGEEIEALAAAHGTEVPDEGASNVFSMGSGLDKRIGALGRVPGPAGDGPDGALLVVMSRETAAASQQDIASAIGEARRKGARVSWPILLGLLIVSATLAIYLPYLEAIGPLNRLTQEFGALSVGQQHQVFHDRYAGVPGRTAHAAATAYEALRQAFLAELEIEDDGVEEEVSRRSSRRRRLTRAHQKLGEGDVGGRPKTGARPSTAAAAEGTTATPPAPTPDPAPAPAPVLPAPQAPADPAPQPVPAASPQPATAAPVHPSPPVQSPAAPLPPQQAPPVPATPTPIPREPVAAPPGGTAPQPVPPSEHDFHEVFEEFVQVKQACGEPTANLTYERFAAKLRKNERDLKAKRPDIKRVQFTVYVKDGKAALKAKVIK